MKKVALIFSGCGGLDGSEISEAVFALLSLDQQNIEYKIFAPRDVNFDAKIHLFENQAYFMQDAELPAKRNAFVEAARIARGNIADIGDLNIDEFDALVMPGGYGAVNNLNISVVKDLIRGFHSAKKPILAICVAPALVAASIDGVTITLGNIGNRAGIEKPNTKFESKQSNEFYVDVENKIYSTPALMNGDDRPSRFFTGIDLAIKQMIIDNQ